MGIRGLSLFLEQNKGRFFSPRAKVRGKLVVDGNSVLHELFVNRQLDWLNGGRYDKQHAGTLEFFEPLVRAGVEPIVILDGGGCDTHVKDTIKRRKEGIGEFQVDMRRQQENRDGVNHGCYHLPPLSRQVFASSLKQLDGVQVYVPDGKAVHTILGLAEHFNCPVLTNSNYYCVSGVTGGVILHKDLDLTSCTAPIFFQSELAKSLDFQNPDLMLAVAAIIGDSGSKILPKLYHGIIKRKIEEICIHKKIEQPNERSWILNIADFINHYNCTCFKDFEDKIPEFSFGLRVRSSLSTNCFKVKQYLTTQSRITMDALKTTTLLRCSGLASQIPVNVVERYREGNFPIAVMNAICVGKCTLDSDIGDPEQLPIPRLGRYTRRLIYGLAVPLMSTSYAHGVEEYYRSTAIINSERNPCWDYMAYTEEPLHMIEYKKLSVDHIFKLDKRDRELLAMEAFFEILMCPKETSSKFDKLSKTTYLLGVLTTHRWLRHLLNDKDRCQKFDRPYLLARAVVLCFLRERSDDKEGEPEHLYFQAAWIKVYHAILEWQRLYHDACDLNMMLLSPFLELLPENIIDGAFVIELALHPNPDGIILECREKLTDRKRNLYDEIVEFLE